jgi:alanine-synthesizing transaminase
MYLFPKLDPKMYPIKDDQEFILKLLIDKKVLLVQGTGFNWKDPDHIRIVFLPNEDDLKESIKRIANYLENFKKNTAN